MKVVYTITLRMLKLQVFAFMSTYLWMPLFIIPIAQFYRCILWCTKNLKIHCTVATSTMVLERKIDFDVLFASQSLLMEKKKLIWSFFLPWNSWFSWKVLSKNYFVYCKFWWWFIIQSNTFKKVLQRLKLQKANAIAHLFSSGLGNAFMCSVKFGKTFHCV